MSLHELLAFFPFDLHGPEFLLFFIALSCGAVLVAWILRAWDPRDVARLREPRRFAGPFRTAEYPPTPWTPGWMPTGDEIVFLAYLERGVPRAMAVLFARAVERGWLDPRTGAVGTLPVDASPLERELWRALEDRYSARDALARVIEAAEPRMRHELRDAGMLRAVTFTRKAIVGLAAVVGTIGIVKVIIGLELGRPVFFLLLGIPVVCICLVAMAFWLPARTRAGRDYVRWARDALAPVTGGPLTPPTVDGLSLKTVFSPMDGGGPLALLIPSILAYPVQQSWQDASLRDEAALATSQARGNGGGLDGGGGSSCGGGGSSCGGGSCGGGGCGGCGGGGD